MFSCLCFLLDIWRLMLSDCLTLDFKTRIHFINKRTFSLVWSIEQGVDYLHQGWCRRGRWSSPGPHRSQSFSGRPACQGKPTPEGWWQCRYECSKWPKMQSRLLQMEILHWILSIQATKTLHLPTCELCCLVENVACHALALVLPTWSSPYHSITRKTYERKKWNMHKYNWLYMPFKRRDLYFF